jgi:hypothetical protein
MQSGEAEAMTMVQGREEEEDIVAEVMKLEKTVETLVYSSMLRK